MAYKLDNGSLRVGSNVTFRGEKFVFIGESGDVELVPFGAHIRDSVRVNRHDFINNGRLIEQTGKGWRVNSEWHRKYRVRNSKEIEVKGIKGIVVLIEFTKPLKRRDEHTGKDEHTGNFVGASVTVAPGIYMNESNPIIFYGYRGDTWEKTEIKEFERAARAMKAHIEYRKCQKCGSYKPPRMSSRRAGRELTYVTSVCVDCGHKEVEPYD